MSVTFIVATTLSIIAVGFLAGATMLTRGAEAGVSHNASLFKTGNPSLEGSSAHLSHAELQAYEGPSVNR